MRARAVLVAVLGLAVVPDAPARSAVGWQTDPYYVEVESEAKGEPLRRVFLPKGETAETWTERIELSEIVIEPGASPRILLAARAETESAQCAGFDDQPVRLPESAPANVALSLWHCPQRLLTGEGWVKSAFVVLGQDRAWFMIAEGRYPAHDKSTFPLRKDQSDRWWPMQFSLGLCDSLIRPGCVPDASLLVEGKPAKLTLDEAQAVERVAERGRQIYVQDQMAWHATDFVLENDLIKADGKGHFIAVPNPTGGGYVYFIRDRVFGKTKARRVAFDTSGKLSADTEEVTLDPDVAGRFKALRTAKSSKALRFCSELVNSVVLADDEGDGWLVYLMSATREPNRMVLGGHNRVKVSRDGKQVLSVDYSANSCLVMETDATGPEGQEPEFMMVTHLVSDLPWETHVFQSISFDRPMIVLTGSSAWRVRGDSLEKIDLEGGS